MNLPLRFDSTFFEKSRLSILTILFRDEEVSFNRLKTILEFTDGALYSHLRKLIDGGYINGKKQIVANNALTIYRLTKKGKNEFSDYLKFLSQFVNDLDSDSGSGKEEKR